MRIFKSLADSQTEENTELKATILFAPTYTVNHTFVRRVKDTKRILKNPPPLFSLQRSQIMFRQR